MKQQFQSVPRWLRKHFTTDVQIVCLKSRHLKAHRLPGAEGTSERTPDQNRSLDFLICDATILRLDIQLQALVAEVADEGAGQQGHAGNGQQLQEPLPGEQVIQRRHLRQHDAGLDADEIVRQEAYKGGHEMSKNYDCQKQSRRGGRSRSSSCNSGCISMIIIIIVILVVVIINAYVITLYHCIISANFFC